MDENNPYSKKLSKTVYVAKFIAVFSIVSAHITLTGVDGIPLAILRRFSSIGVIVFFISSALYFKTSPGNFAGFIKKKLTTIVVPWIFLGSVVYFSNNSSSSYSLCNLCMWLVGYKTYLWYIPVLLMLFLVFYKYYESKVFCFTCIAITVISLLLTATHIIDPLISALHITNYLFLPNWVGVFAIGCLLKMYHVPEKLFSLKPVYVVTILVTYIVLLVVAAFIEPNQSGYFSKFGLLLELYGATLVLYISSKIRCVKIIKLIAQYSYSIYLLHFIPITIVSKIFGHIPGLPNWLSILYFIPVTIISFAIIYIGMLVSRTIKLDKLYSLIMGIRVQKG